MCATGSVEQWFPLVPLSSSAPPFIHVAGSLEGPVGVPLHSHLQPACDQGYQQERGLRHPQTRQLWLTAGLGCPLYGL